MHSGRQCLLLEGLGLQPSKHLDNDGELAPASTAVATGPWSSLLIYHNWLLVNKLAGLSHTVKLGS